MSPGARRAPLSVPASDARKLAKALSSIADEVVVDLEDAVAISEKDAARASVGGLSRRRRGRLAIRVNAVVTPWFADDVATCASNPAIDSIVLPKTEGPQALQDLATRLDGLEPAGRRPLGIQALVESAAGVHRATDLAAAAELVESLILGCADLSASMGRRIGSSWQFAQDAVVLVARMAGIQAIDGPLLTIADDDVLSDAAANAEALGFDGKWVIHPAHLDTVTAAFTPCADDIAASRGILAALADANEAGRGACQWRGRMLDEAVAANARRVLGRAGAL